MNIALRLKKEGFGYISKEIVKFVGYPQSESARFMCSLRGEDNLISVTKAVEELDFKQCSVCNGPCLHIYFRDLCFLALDFGYMMVLLSPSRHGQKNVYDLYT